MAEAKEVCKICYNSTSHKPVPTLTHEPQEESSGGAGGKKNICTVCRQEWAPIRVAKELGSSRWVRIRPRPKLQMHIDFMICKNVNSHNDCQRGQDCSFAHSRAELWAWNQERQKEPRSAPTINGSYQYQMCKYIAKSGSCPYGSKCTFAHSDEELANWLKFQERNASTLVQFKGSNYRCNVCHYRCNSKKQLEDHISNFKHRQYAGGGGAGGRSNSGDRPNQMAANGRVAGARRQTRPRPSVSVPISGYRLCTHVQSGRRCLYGDYCTFAHSQMELEEWNQQIREQGSSSKFTSKSNSRETIEQVSSSSRNKAHSPSASLTATTSSPSASLRIATTSSSYSRGDEGKDFSASVRDKIAKQCKDKGSVSGMEEQVEGVRVVEVSGKALALEVKTDSVVQWVFELTTTVPHTLHSVVFFDTVSPHFSLAGVFRYGSSGAWEQLSGREAGPKHGVGLQINFKMAVSDKVRVKVNANPRSGMLGQLVVFHVSSSCVVRCCVVHRVSALEEHQVPPPATRTSHSKRPVDVDLFWEQHYRTVGLDTNIAMEDTDKQLPEYLLPPQIEDFIKKGKYKNVENKVTRENYKRRMHNLLYLEEFQQRVGLSRYDLYGVEIKVETSYSTRGGGTVYGQNGERFFTVYMDELLLEKGQTVRSSDSVLCVPNNQDVAHECYVEHVGKEHVTLRITDKAHQACAASRFCVSVRFILGRVPMRAMHYAVDQLELGSIFPGIQNTSTEVIPTSQEVRVCLDVLKKSELNDCQVQAITSMLEPSCVEIPSLVLGPFGCGKTRTLCESIKLLLQHMPQTRLLVCTHSNSAADIYVEKLHEWKSKGSAVNFNLVRVYYTLRNLGAISRDIHQYCLMKNGRLRLPTLSELKQYRVVVVTLTTARILSLTGLKKGHFSHIFIDEAAQALESESLVPLCLANSSTKIVLAGDHMQLDPPVYSDIARKYNLHLSLLERLFDAESYETGLGALCKTVLTENHRSHQLIMDLPSQLFYKNKLTCKSIFPPGGPNIPAVKFVSVEGHEEQDEDSPSFYNKHEADKVVEQVEALVGGGVRPDEVCVLVYYRKQIIYIRLCLRKKKLGQVNVRTVEDVQGRGYRALVISTVRTSASELLSEREAGFLINPKLFNTAVTRAKQWLVVVGDPVTLCTMGSNRLCWMEYIRRCISLKSFDHPHPTQFEDSLNYKMLTRQLLESTHSSFFRAGYHPAVMNETSPEQEEDGEEVVTSMTIVADAGPRVSVVQERKQELVSGARDAAAAQRVAVQGGSEISMVSSEAASGSRENGKSESGGSQSRPIDMLASRSRDASVSSSHDVSTSRTQDDSASRTQGASASQDSAGSRTTYSSASSMQGISSSRKQDSKTRDMSSRSQESAASRQDMSSKSKSILSSRTENNSPSKPRDGPVLKTKDRIAESSTSKQKLLASRSSKANPSSAALAKDNYSSSSKGSSGSSKPVTTKKSSNALVTNEANHVDDKSSYATDDLPPFLCGLLDSLHSYSLWCESQLSASYPLRHSHRISQNLEKHKALLEKQQEIADDQVDLYGDLMNLLNQAFPGGSGSGGELSNAGGPLSQGYLYPGGNLSQGYGGPPGALSQEMMAGAGPMVSSTYRPVMAGPRMSNHYQQLPLHHHSQQQQQQQQQLVFPSALPSSYPNTLSGVGLQSTFTTNDLYGSEYIAGETLPR